MDFHQRKLTRAEWQSVEVPVVEEEKRILELLVRGYHDPHIRTNRHLTLYSILKIQPSPEMDEFLYHLRFEKWLTNLHVEEEDPLFFEEKGEKQKEKDKSSERSGKSPDGLEAARGKNKGDN